MQPLPSTYCPWNKSKTGPPPCGRSGPRFLDWPKDCLSFKSCSLNSLRRHFIAPIVRNPKILSGTDIFFGPQTESACSGGAVGLAKKHSPARLGLWTSSTRSGTFCNPYEISFARAFLNGASRGFWVSTVARSHGRSFISRCLHVLTISSFYAVWFSSLLPSSNLMKWKLLSTAN